MILGSHMGGGCLASHTLTPGERVWGCWYNLSGGKHSYDSGTSIIRTNGRFICT